MNTARHHVFAILIRSFAILRQQPCKVLVTDIKPPFLWRFHSTKEAEASRMCGLQFFGQVAVRGVRIHERIVRKRRAEAKTDDEAVQLRDRIQLTLCVKDFVE